MAPVFFIFLSVAEGQKKSRPKSGSLLLVIHFFIYSLLKLQSKAAEYSPALGGCFGQWLR